MEWVDSLKGVGILSVVVGHIYSGVLKDIIFVFHMPLFFFMAGYLFKPRQQIKEYFTKKVYHLLIPYIAFLFILFIPQVVEIVNSSNVGLPFLLKTIAKALVGGRYLQGWTGVFWFITCLFITQQIVNYLVVKFSENVVASIMVILLLIGYVNDTFFQQYWLPFNANVACIAAPIFYIGYLMRNAGFSNFILFGAAVVSMISIIAVYYGVELSYDMKGANYGLPLASLIAALAFIIVLVRLSKALSLIPLLSPVLGYIGSGSMVIMYLHQPIQASLRDSFGVDSELIRFGFALVFPIILFFFLKRVSALRGIFLGSERDLKKLILNHKD